MSMVTLTDPQSATRVCVDWNGAGNPTPADLVTLGYPGWQFVSRSAGMPVEQMSAQDIEDGRLNTLTNAELMAEMKAWAAANLAPKPNL